MFWQTVRKLISRRWVRGILIGGGVSIASVMAFFVWAQTYEGRLGPNVWIGGRFVGGMEEVRAKEEIQQAVDEILAQGVEISTGETTRTLALATLVGTDMTERAVFDVNTALLQAQEALHMSAWTAPFFLVRNFFSPVHISVPVTLQESALVNDAYALFPELMLEAKEPSFVFTLDQVLWQAEVVSGQAGNEMDEATFLRTLREQLSTFDRAPIVLSVQYIAPTISVEQAQAQVPQALMWMSLAPIVFSAAHGEYTGTVFLSQLDLLPMIIPSSGEAPTLSKEKFDLWLEQAATDLESSAVNAKFEIENGRVKEFVPNTPGFSVDHEQTYANFLSFLEQGNREIQVEMPFVQTQPELEVSEVNDLGILEKLGTGTSSYRGSPSNRILNIANGVHLLQGVLIAPDQTFSLLDALRPFDETNGYYAELVIKGDKIEPEMGGGLCQIGTTTFRAAMNAGLPIVERRNHSLVVSYYNDLQNGNPGTDATIYDPAPDLKFLNDTGHYLLFQAEMDTQTQQLRFSFWGTSDGRRGTYSAPMVSSWIPVGETQKIETLDLEPGQEKCQGSHIGANASFVYTVQKPDGTTEEQIFESHYRPLPEICLVGVEELTSVAEELGEEGETDILETDEEATEEQEAAEDVIVP